MKVDAIQGNDRRQSVMAQISKGAAIGAASGVVFQYTYPLTPEEKSTDKYINITKKINNQKTEFNFLTKKYLESIKTKEPKSLAKDEFVKLFDGLKEGEHIKKSKIRSAIEIIKDQKPSDLFEFKKLCKASSEIADQIAKKVISAYNLITKHNRPTEFFLVTGAVVGAIIAMINNIIKIEDVN
ncbi:MAG: hypothetical protein K2F57_04610 [Candidatus Gastranaerophilales bacterium]|nr:hypothetical protein [Candidatus Gastranaerophilales bacterium]